MTNLIEDMNRYDLYAGLDTRLHGLYIDKSTKPQTICQIIKNIIKPGYGVYMGIGGI